MAPHANGLERSSLNETTGEAWNGTTTTGRGSLCPLQEECTDELDRKYWCLHGGTCCLIGGFKHCSCIEPWLPPRCEKKSAAEIDFSKMKDQFDAKITIAAVSCFVGVIVLALLIIIIVLLIRSSQWMEKYRTKKLLENASRKSMLDKPNPKEFPKSVDSTMSGYSWRESRRSCMTASRTMSRSVPEGLDEANDMDSVLKCLTGEESNVAFNTMLWSSLICKSADLAIVTTAAVPTEAVPTEGVPTEGVPTEGVPTEVVHTKGVLTEGVPTEGVPTEAFSTETVPTKVVPTEVITKNGLTNTDPPNFELIDSERKSSNEEDHSSSEGAEVTCDTPL